MPEKVLITGASSDIGFEIAQRFDVPGNILMLHCNKNQQKLAELTKKFTAQVVIFSADFMNDAEVDALISNVKDISILINCAAYTKTDILVNLSDEDIRKMLQVNVFVPVKISRNLVPQMIVKRKGTIVNITSVSATKGNRGSSVYGGTKAFLESFTRSLAAEYGIKGLRVNCVAPGAVDAGSLKELIKMAPDEVKGSIASNRLGNPGDVASLVHYLCSGDAAFINGQTVHVDGGFMKGV